MFSTLIVTDVYLAWSDKILIWQNISTGINALEILRGSSPFVLPFPSLQSWLLQGSNALMDPCRSNWRC